MILLYSIRPCMSRIPLTSQSLKVEALWYSYKCTAGQTEHQPIRCPGWDGFGPSVIGFPAVREIRTNRPPWRPDNQAGFTRALQVAYYSWELYSGQIQSARHCRQGLRPLSEGAGKRREEFWGICCCLSCQFSSLWVVALDPFS